MGGVDVFWGVVVVVVVVVIGGVGVAGTVAEVGVVVVGLLRRFGLNLLRRCLLRAAILRARVCIGVGMLMGGGEGGAISGVLGVGGGVLVGDISPEH